MDTGEPCPDIRPSCPESGLNFDTETECEPQGRRWASGAPKLNHVPLFRCAEKRHLRINDNFARRSRNDKVKGWFRTASYDRGEEPAVAGPSGLGGNAGDQRTRHTGMQELAA